MKFEKNSFLKKRKKQRKLGLFLFLASPILFLVDWTTPFPTPIRGAGTVYWIVAWFVGIYIYLQSQRLPVTEAILVAEESNGELTIPSLMNKMGIDQVSAEAILNEVEKQGFARKEKRGGATVWLFADYIEDEQPLERVLVLAKNSGNLLTVADIVDNLNLSIEETEGVLKRLEEKGYCKKNTIPGSQDWLF